MELKSKKISIVNIDSVVINPRNANTHSEKQLEMLAKIIKHNGFRQPLIISNRSKFLICGHGRLAAAKKLGMGKIPVMFQDFDSEASEFQAMIADNKIAELAEHDDVKMLEGIKELELENLDMELLGLVDLNFETENNAVDEISDSLKEGCEEVRFILSTEQKDILNEALEKAKLEEDCTDELNPDAKGNTLTAILKRYICG